MKNNLLTSMFVCLLAFSTLFSCWQIYKYNTSIHRFQAIQPKALEVNKVMGIVQSLFNDTVAYNQAAKNPEMTRLLQSMTAPGKPAAKVPAK